MAVFLGDRLQRRAIGGKNEFGGGAVIDFESLHLAIEAAAVAQELKVRCRALLGLKRGHLDFRVRDPVEFLLSWAGIERAATAVQSKARIECDATRGVSDRNGGVVDPEGCGASIVSPSRRSALGIESKQFKRMTLRVAKLERLDAARSGGSICGPSIVIALQPV